MDTEHTATSPITVLICESSAVQLRILKQAVQEAGFEVHATQSAEDALSLLRLMPIDIFLTGIEVGGVTGLEACWSLKSNTETESIYTIVITASGEERRLEESLDAGADDFIRKPVNMTELRARLRAASRLIRMQKQFRRLAETDALTGAANRRSFMSYLDMQMTQARRTAQPFSVAMLDLDHFKSINDTHGHAAGDTVLIETVKSIQAQLRDRDMLGRLGGEEFAVIFHNAELDDAYGATERLRLALQNLNITQDSGKVIPVTASLGLAESLPDADFDTPEALLQAADDALYEAKSGGRNRVVMAQRSDNSIDRLHRYG
ncbi:diguanylate cyclase [Maricaulis sp. D1M11]|uniref:GGDEF domain-containing response regulator n=1 Tax=Maricaulis sp. D1M11 TaxID=3076117 RepID=UPI0039B588C3